MSFAILVCHANDSTALLVLFTRVRGRGILGNSDGHLHPASHPCLVVRVLLSESALQVALLHWREIISEPCSTAQESEAKEGDAVIKVGAVVATRGRAALLGNSFVKAIQLAKEELTNTTHQYQLVIEEITSPDKAESAIEKLIEADKVDALVVGLSISGQIAKSYATAAKIPVFCICSVGSIGDELYTFTTMPLAEDEATLWVAEANRKGIKSIALLTQDYPSIDGHVRALRAETAKAGIAFVYEDRFAAATTDFRTKIAAAKGT